MQIPPALQALGIERIVVFDAETYWATDYTLSKLDTRAYVRDPRYKTHGFSLAHGLDGYPVWASDLTAQQMLLASVDWSKAALLCTNVRFDGCILAERYGIRPKLYLCTVAMANAHVKPFTGFSSLDATHRWLAARFPHRNPPTPKGNVTLSFKGITDLSPSALETVGDYCCHDVRLTQWCASVMLPWFTAEELLLQHQTHEAYLKPVLRIDTSHLTQHIRAERARKDALLQSVSQVKGSLMSNDKLAELLRQNGVQPPTKISPTTGNPTYAFAKTDLQFTILQEHPNPQVALLVQARLGVKSTIEETRAQSLIDLVESDQDPAPVALSYCGAATTRHSGAGGKTNFQNIGRTSPIRKALLAPPGHKLISSDASQIEARCMAWLANETLAMESFRNGQDLYSVVGSRMFERPISKATTPDLRHLSKVACLACQFALGGAGFQQTARMGGVELTLDSAKDVVARWRKANPNIVKLWAKLLNLYEWAARERPTTVRCLGPLVFGYNALRDAVFIRLPTGLHVWYPEPRYVETERRSGWAFTNVRSKNPVFFSKNLVSNNPVQALARSITLGTHAVQLQQRYNLRWILTIHDELVFCVPEKYAERVATLVRDTMRVSPLWWPDLVLDAEAHIGDTYGDLK